MAVQRRRVAERMGDASEANLAVLERQVERAEPLTAGEAPAVIRVDTTGAPDLDGLLEFIGGAN
jgi:predicted kinase